ncbi:hypothetical protein Leryth_023462 [Lithospermum erythrorhizon]|nr:hypothetical protein Leryth_023462 [Lithospermum erythrorhizon]
MPKSLSRPSVLNWLDVSNSQLTGPIPESTQMDRIIEPSFYANNSGLCGAQIQKPCNSRKEGAPPPIQFVENKDDQEEVFSWIFAGFGFPIGFLSTLCIVYILGFFTRVNHRGNW